MVGLIVIAVLYVINLAFFRWLGGISSAGDTIAEWRRSTAEKRRRALSSS
jgi:hypothetical protein